jgi:hypothetical protein
MISLAPTANSSFQIVGELQLMKWFLASFGVSPKIKVAFAVTIDDFKSQVK